MLDKSAAVVGKLLAIVVTIGGCFLIVTGSEFLRELIGLTRNQWQDGTVAGIALALLHERVLSLRSGR